ncbi:MAG: thiamine pyrophosphate-dependent enzyme [Chloroflexota bacterium]
MTSEFDFSGFDKEEILSWYKTMNLGRRLDDKAALYLKMAKGWSYHASFAGHDGIQLALGKIFRPKFDYLFPYYRDMLTCFAAGITAEEIILNGLSRETDIAGGGRHMSNHFAKLELNIQNVSSNTGNHSLHAAGVARAAKYYKTGEVAYYSSGESATSEGYFWEAINVASLEKLPVIFVIQNNRYGISVPIDDQTANHRVSDNYRGMRNLKIINCDGRDPFDSYKALQEAREYVESGAGPAMVHADCDRIRSHSNSDRHEIYRSQAELTAVKRRDPMLQFRMKIINSGLASKEEIEAIEEKNKQELFRAADKAEAAPHADPKSVLDFIVPEPKYKPADNTEYELPSSGERISYIESLNRTLKEEFQANPNTFMWGQDIGKGGVFNVVKGLPQEFGKGRVFNAPIAEDAIVGTANGFCRYNNKDIRVVIEGAEFADYFWPAMEQLVECSHDYWRTKGQFSANITIRLASGGYIQGGLYHSQNLEATFATLPGLRIVAPAFADDAAGLLRNSIRSQGVTMFLEPKFLYNFKQAYGPVTKPDYVVPFGKAKIRREGKDITIVTYGNAVHLSLLAAQDLEKEGISCEVVDLRSLVPWDVETVMASVAKTSRAVVAQEDRLMTSIASEVSSVITERGFKFLDAPVRRAGSKPTPVGFAKELESAILLSKEEVVRAVRETLKY